MAGGQNVTSPHEFQVVFICNIGILKNTFIKSYLKSTTPPYCTVPLSVIIFWDVSFAPCKGIQDSLGFWIPCCGFRIPGTGFRIPAQWIPDSKKRWIPFFSRFNAFLRTSFSCSNLAILQDVVRRHNKFVFFFDLQNY